MGMVSLTALNMLGDGEETDSDCPVHLNPPCDAGTWNGCYDNEVCNNDECECDAEACLNAAYACEHEGVQVADAGAYTDRDPMLSLFLVATCLFFRFAPRGR